MTRRLAAAALAVLGIGGVQAQQRQISGHGAYRVLYLVGTRQAARIDLRSGSKQVWQLVTQAGMQVGDECTARHAPITCDWYASDAILDMANKRLYFIAPNTAPGDTPDSDEDGSGRGPMSVWAFDLEGMRLVDSVEVSALQSIILTADGKQLLVAYGKPPSTVDTYDAGTMKKMGTLTNAGHNQMDTYFAPGSYFLPNGKSIVDGGASYFRIRVEAGHFQQETVDPRTHLPAEDLKKLSGFVKTQKNGQKLLLTVPASSRGGKYLFYVANDGYTRSAFWTVDVETGQTSPAVVLGYFGKAELIRSGDQFTVFEGVITTNEGNSYEFSRTGRVTIYEVETGALVREFNKAELKGVGNVLCLSPNGMVAAYARGHNVSTVDFGSGDVKAVGTVTDVPEQAYAGACGFER